MKGGRQCDGAGRGENGETEEGRGGGGRIGKKVRRPPLVEEVLAHEEVAVSVAWRQEGAVPRRLAPRADLLEAAACPVYVVCGKQRQQQASRALLRRRQLL